MRAGTIQETDQSGNDPGPVKFRIRVIGTNTYVSAGLKDQYETTEIHVDVNIVKNDILDTEAFKKWMPDYAHAEFILEMENMSVDGQ